MQTVFGRGTPHSSCPPVTTYGMLNEGIPILPAGLFDWAVGGDHVHPISRFHRWFWVTMILFIALLGCAATSRAAVTREEVERAIRDGVRFLKLQQRDDGSWADVENDARTGVTSMVTLALLTAGERPDSKNIKDALEYLRGFGPNDLHSTYAISLQTMVFATADPAKDELRIRANVAWLEEAQIKPGDPQSYPGSWSYSESKRGRPGDNSNTQYALLGLHAASEVGIPVKPTVWELSRSYWERSPETRRELGLHSRLP